MAERSIPTPESLRKLLRYDPESGLLFWRQRTPDMMQHVSRSVEQACLAWNVRWCGTEAFTATRNGYRVGNINNRTFAAHRVAWAIHHGNWPTGDIDHRDGNRSNNAIANLRDVTRQQNLRNMKKSTHNTSGITGVYRNTHTRLWSAKISVGNKSRHLGYFKTIEAAAAARAEAEASLGFSAGHGRRT